jgi:hypothetical protein
MQKFKKFIMIFGLEYSVLWSVIIYFLWDEGPFVYTVLDAIAGIVIIYIGYKIYKDKPVTKGNDYLYTALVLVSLIYNSIWTLVIMLFLEIDLAGLGLPLDLISLYATCTLAYRVWESTKQYYLMHYKY